MSNILIFLDIMNNTQKIILFAVLGLITYFVCQFIIDFIEGFTMSFKKSVAFIKSLDEKLKKGEITKEEYDKKFDEYMKSVSNGDLS